MIERDFYRLSVLAEMWRCSTADILHLGIQNRAMVCVNLYGERSKMTFRHAYPHTGVTRSSLDAVANVHAASHFNNSDADDGSDVGAPIDDVQAAKTEQFMAAFRERIEAGLFDLRPEQLRRIERPGATPFKLAYSFLHFVHWWRVDFLPAPVIGIENLCMRQAEVDRIERDVLCSTAAEGAESESAVAIQPTRFDPNQSESAEQLDLQVATQKFAQLGADARHKENREMKQKARQLYKENEGKPGYTNKTVAAQTMAGKLIAGEIGTIREWLKDPKKGR
ncbi:MAG: hypothetical protein KA439_09735 [Rhizobacter sp.]|nr:hypothetical protein [Rhizobacter sp.]